MCVNINIKYNFRNRDSILLSKDCMYSYIIIIGIKILLSIV